MGIGRKGGEENTAQTTEEGQMLLLQIIIFGGQESNKCLLTLASVVFKGGIHPMCTNLLYCFFFPPS